MKIAVIGYSGSGKSTLARQLGQQFSLPVLHLDRVHWLPGWQERTQPDCIARVEAFLDAHPGGWIIDGNYASFAYKRRMAEAQRILLLDFPRHICLTRAIKRYLTYRGRTREDMGADCNEKIDWEFICWLLRDGRTPAIRARYDGLARQYPDKLVRLKSPGQVKRYLEEVTRDDLSCVSEKG